MSQKIAKRYTFAGLPIAVENPAGSERTWEGDRGVVGRTTMRHDYGYIEGTEGTDGDEVDVYVGPEVNARFAYVVHQLVTPGYDAHDEDKVFLGFASEADAKAAFLAHRNDGELAYGGMSAIPLGEFVRKIEDRTGAGKIRHQRFAAEHLVDAIASRTSGMIGLEAMDRGFREVAIGPSVRRFDALPGAVRAGVWDRGATFGEKVKNGRKSDFNTFTFGQMIDNWLKRGEKLSLCANHQSAYTEVNGQPAPALAYYDAIALVAAGEVMRFVKLHSSSAVEPSCAELTALVSSLATDLNPRPSCDGLWFFRSAVTPEGQELLPNLAFISPMFTNTGFDENGLAQGYTLIDLAATNTAFQAGCVITFERASGPTQPKEGSEMAAKLSKVMSKFVKYEADADDKTVKAACMKKMEGDAKEAMDAEDGAFDYAGKAAELEAMAKAYEDANVEDEEGEEKPQVAMRRYAAKFRKMSAPAEGAVKAEGDKKPEKKPEEMEGADEAFERLARPRLVSMAQRLGVEVKPSYTARQLFDAVNAAAVPQGNVGEIVKEQVRIAMLEREAKDKGVLLERNAKELASAAVKSGYPKENEELLVKFAITDFDGAKKLVSKYVGELETAQLFSRMTSGGAPFGVDGRAAPIATQQASGPDVRVVENDIGTFVIQGERFSRMCQEAADAKDGPMKEKIDAMLSDDERSHPGLRLYAANNLLKREKPEMFQQTRPELFGRF